jgi:hypothetical protein
MKYFVTGFLLIESIWATLIFTPGTSPNFSVVPPSPPIVMSYTQSSTAVSPQALRIAAAAQETTIRINIPKAPTNNAILKIWAKTDTETDIQYSLGSNDTVLGFESIGTYLPKGIAKTWQEATIPLIQTGDTLYLKFLPNTHYQKIIIYIDAIEITQNTNIAPVSKSHVINTLPITTNTLLGTQIFYPLYPQLTTFNASSYTKLSIALKNTQPLTIRAAVITAEDYRHEQAHVPYFRYWSVYAIGEPNLHTLVLPIPSKELIGVILECDAENKNLFTVKQISLE